MLCDTEILNSNRIAGVTRALPTFPICSPGSAAGWRATSRPPVWLMSRMENRFSLKCRITHCESPLPRPCARAFCFFCFFALAVTKFILLMDGRRLTVGERRGNNQTASAPQALHGLNKSPTGEAGFTFRTSANGSCIILAGLWWDFLSSVIVSFLRQRLNSPLLSFPRSRASDTQISTAGRLPEAFKSVTRNPGMHSVIGRHSQSVCVSRRGYLQI